MRETWSRMMSKLPCLFVGASGPSPRSGKRSAPRPGGNNGGRGGGGGSTVKLSLSCWRPRKRDPLFAACQEKKERPARAREGWGGKRREGEGRGGKEGEGEGRGGKKPSILHSHNLHVRQSINAGSPPDQFPIEDLSGLKDESTNL